MRGTCGVLCGAFSAAKNMPGFSTLFFVIPVLGSAVKKERHTPGTKEGVKKCLTKQKADLRG
jgi:hypothetical protein